MMGLAALLLGLLLPVAAAAFAILRWVPPGTAGRWAIVAGYGLAFGVFAPAALLWIAGWAGWPLTYAPTLAASAFLLVLCAAPWRGLPRLYGRDRLPAQPRLSRGSAIATALFGTLILVHAGMIASELVLRPMYPWEAWTQWATKAKAWFFARAMVPFASPEAWLAAPNGSVYTDASPHVLPVVPLMQTWMALGLGEWSERLVNLPWLALWLALVAATYGQARAWPLPRPVAAFLAYAVGSLPLVTVHASLAGYPDLAQAVAYTLAGLALLAWEKGRARWQCGLGLVAVGLCVLVQHAGLVWGATLGVVALFALAPRRAPAILAASALAVGAALAVLGQVQPTLFGFRVDLTLDPQWRAMLENTVLSGNWGLLFLLLPAAVLLGWATALDRELRAFSALVGTGAVMLVSIFFVGGARTWVEDSTVSRAILHWAPLATFYAFALLAASRLPKRLALRLKPDEGADAGTADRGAPALTSGGASST